ncbi:MAG: histidine phosphatase family protein [Candidatus Magasanikbacteria bacterium]
MANHIPHVTILFTRNEDFAATPEQPLTTEGAERATKRGHALREQGYEIDAVVSSPAPQAIATAQAMLNGYGQSMDVNTDARLGDFESDPRATELVNVLKNRAIEKFGDANDMSLAKILPEVPEIHPLLAARAKEGADALTEIVHADVDLRARWHSNHERPLKTILVVSHGIARMEATVTQLWRNWGYEQDDIPQIWEIDSPLEKGRVYELSFGQHDWGKPFGLVLGERDVLGF